MPSPPPTPPVPISAVHVGGNQILITFDSPLVQSNPMPFNFTGRLSDFLFIGSSAVIGVDGALTIGVTTSTSQVGADFVTWIDTFSDLIGVNGLYVASFSEFLTT